MKQEQSRPAMKTEDYTDPICPFDTSQYEREPKPVTVPLMRILEREDALLSANDYEGAERLLQYWIREAEEGRDRQGLFSLKNELMGLYRKTEREQEAFRAAEDALQLIPAVGADSVAAGTAYVNAATVMKAFGRAEEAIPLFEKARVIYERELPEDAWKLGGLYNNAALAYVDLARFEEAEELYRRAIAVMEKTENGVPELAVTYLNLADLIMLRDGLEEGDREIGSCLDTAEALLDREDVAHDGNYAYVCEKCAPVFHYYGRFLFGLELEQRAAAIYASAGQGQERVL